MGVVLSVSALESHRELIDRFIGEAAIPVNDSFWEDLLTFPCPLPKLNPSDVDEVTQASCSLLAKNNLMTGHLPKLVLRMSRLLQELPSPTSKLPIMAINAVYFTRLVLKHFSENYDSTEIAMHMSTCYLEDNTDVPVVAVRTLLSVLASTDVNPSTYLLHLEITNLLLVMASTQIHNQSGVDNHLFLDLIMAQDDLGAPVVRKLLVSYIARLSLPPRVPLYVPRSNSQAEMGSVLRKVGTAAVAVFLLPYYTYAYLVNSGKAGGMGKNSPLADNCLLLLLLLVHHGKVVDSSKEKSKSQVTQSNFDEREVMPSAVEEPRVYEHNPFKTALQAVKDREFADQSTEDQSLLPLQVSFAALYDTLSLCSIDDRSTLLLYSLVHGNPDFLEYLLVRADLDTLLLPLLEMLYDAPRRTTNQIYMLLIILLILSQDASFNANVHKLILPGVPWYRERLLPRITLGSLMVVVLIRTVKYNLSRLRDVYLHTNCLATLANMAPHAHQLNAYASQRLISLFQMLAKKYMKLSDANQNSKETAPPVAVSSGEHSGEKDNVPTELHIYTDFLRIVLEIINAILTYALPRNPEVVYALLHRQEIFLPFRYHPRFHELLENIFTVIEFFNVRMDEHTMDGEWSVEKVLEIVVANARAWRGDGMKMFTELRFTYEEELHPEEFFVPYVWTLIVSRGSIPWNLDCITLFPSRPVGELDVMFDHDNFDTNSEFSATPREQV